MPPDLRPDTGSEFTEFRDKPDLLNILFMNMKKIYFLLLGSLFDVRRSNDLLHIGRIGWRFHQFA